MKVRCQITNNTAKQYLFSKSRAKGIQIVNDTNFQLNVYEDFYISTSSRARYCGLCHKRSTMFQQSKAVSLKEMLMILNNSLEVARHPHTKVFL